MVPMVPGMIWYTSRNRLERERKRETGTNTVGTTYYCGLFCWMTTTATDGQTDGRTDLLVLTRYGFPIQRLVWFLFTKFVSCSFLFCCWAFVFFFQYRFLNKNDLTYFFLFFFLQESKWIFSHLSTGMTDRAVKLSPTVTEIDRTKRWCKVGGIYLYSEYNFMIDSD